MPPKRLKEMHYSCRLIKRYFRLCSSINNRVFHLLVYIIPRKEDKQVGVLRTNQRMISGLPAHWPIPPPLLRVYRHPRREGPMLTSHKIKTRFLIG